MRYLSILFIFIFWSSCYGQNPVIDVVNMQFLYADHIYYSFDQGITASNMGKSWNIGFSVPGKDNAGVFFNEYAERDMKPAVLQKAPTNTFSDLILPSDLIGADTLRNLEENWTTGAFNLQNNPSNVNDFGWGEYQSGIGVIGNKVYVVTLPDTTHRKFMIDSLSDDGAYSFKYANLDGSNLITNKLKINDYQDRTLVHYSLVDDAFVDLEPQEWDIFFTRYNAPTSLNGSVTINYNVTGVLAKHGLEIAELDSVSPATADPTTYTGSYSTAANTIGHDWKIFDLDNFEWILDFDRVYFINVGNGVYWKLNFIDFEGAFSGIVYFEKTRYEIPSTALQPTNTIFNDFNIFPNPAKDEIHLTFSLEDFENELAISIANPLGQVVYQAQTKGNKGMNAKSLNDHDLPPGQYFLTLKSPESLVTRPLVITP